MKKVPIILALAAAITAAFLVIRPKPPVPVYYNHKIINIFPHDEKAFTQGLTFENKVLYESTGLHGESTLRRVDLGTGRVKKSHSLASHLFGEGITVYEDKIIQLTWKNHIGFIYDKESFKLTGTFHYPTQGWGITFDGKHLIMSDGTEKLHFLNPQTFQETKTICVYEKDKAITHLNELEYVKGKIYANIWPTDRIAIIEPETGQVTGWITLARLIDRIEHKANLDVPNGIAYDRVGNRLFITGKFWPKLFEIELLPGSYRKSR